MTWIPGDCLSDLKLLMHLAYCWSICSSNTTSLNHELHSGFVLGLLLFSFSFCGICGNEHIQIYFLVSNLTGSDLVLKEFCSNEVWRPKNVDANAESLNTYCALAPGVRFKEKLARILLWHFRYIYMYLCVYISVCVHICIYMYVSFGRKL